MVEKELKIINKNDWYKISKEDLFRFEGASKILRLYSNSMFRLLTTVFPQYGWLPWKFPKSKLFWQDPNNWKHFLDHISKNLNVNKMSGWYKIKPEVNKFFPLLGVYFIESN